MSDTANNHCSATRADGSPCMAPVMEGDRCWAHREGAQAEAERREARIAGGRAHANVARAAKALPAAVQPIWLALSETLEGVRDGSMTAAQGRAVADLSRALLACLEAGEFAERIGELEAAAGKRRTAG